MRVRPATIAALCALAGVCAQRTRRDRKKGDKLDRHSDLRDSHKPRNSAEQRANRLEKYDRLLEMAEKAKADMPQLREQVAELKAREEAILDQDEVLRPPRPPRLGFHAGEDEEEDFEPGGLPYGMENPFSEPADEGPRAPVDQKKREEMMRKSRERLERMRNMDPEERIAEMRRERDERVAARKDGEVDARDYEPALGGKRVWRSKSGDYGPPKPRGLGLENLSPEERHAKLLEHQKLMEDHRSKMDEWREKHEAYMSERRAIMDSYRDLSHQIREAVFASRPL
ncbi:hypothetical protein CTAYLR_006039 [Chrysophaeum taylorii]|uniref:Uncharacterized protein n=1 Tax=Chrysophaeum taylorii TaxID=2483200 RepID=A0AAD7UKB0_9STRA|nr:hypothetical protein CTAYLR_006039 [Chrysophaeum taylorii]